MSRSYSTRLVALTVDVPARWLDNLLSRYPLPGVARRTRGADRSISDDAVLTIELIRILNLELGVSVEAAVRIALSVHGSAESISAYRLPSGLSLSFPLDDIRARMRSRLGEAIEYAAQVPRGRPRVEPGKRR